jgi:hypothetical protein
MLAPDAAAAVDGEIAPVVKLASSLARNTTARATSSGSPMRFIGWVAAKSPRCSRGVSAPENL